tara:strand:+ start:271 stop:513 length:243 start_codon:yes stop_codon:yes gene_type:complete
MTTTELKTFYTETLEEYKTISSKKAFLTRQKKECQEHLEDINEVLNHARPMLYGEPKHQGHAYQMENEIDLINNLYNNLK